MWYLGAPGLELIDTVALWGILFYISPFSLLPLGISVLLLDNRSDVLNHEDVIQRIPSTYCTVSR